MPKSRIQCKTRRQIAEEYDISTRTLSRWLSQHKIVIPYRLLLPAEQALIYSKLGWPPQVDKAPYSPFLDGRTPRLPVLPGIFPLLAIVLLVCLATACGNAPAPETQAAAPTQAAETPVEVKVTALRKTDFPFRTFSSGQLEANRQIVLKAPAGGLVTGLNLREGDLVKKGQILLQLDDRALRLNLEQARLSLKEATLNKNDKLLVYGGQYAVDSSVNRKVFDQILVETGYYRALQAIERAELELKNTALHAPFDGVIAGQKVQLHQQVGPGEEIARLIDRSSFEAVFPLLEQEAVLVRPGQRVRVIPTALPDREMTAEVTSLDPVVSDRGLITVRARLTNPGGTPLFEKMKIEAVLERTLPGQLVVPRSAVVLRSGREVVFTYDPASGLAKWNYVKVSYRNDDSAAIAEGLEPGMTVIWDGNLNLDHDAAVSVAPEEK